VAQIHLAHDELYEHNNEPCFYKRLGNFLTSWATINFSSRNLSLWVT